MGKYPYKIDGTDLMAQEEYVLDQVQAGEIADLMARFGEAEEKRRLRARFLEELLTGGLEGFKVHRRGIIIFHGVVAEALDLENAEIAHIVRLLDCTFKKQANFIDALFQRNLSINDCQFIKEAIFHRIRVEINLFCRNAVFNGMVNFAGSDIGEQFNAHGAQFLGVGKENEANFNHMKVGESLHLREAIFKGGVNFGGADIGGQFNARGAQFLGVGKENEANFNHMKVGHSVTLREVIFQGLVNFGGSNICGQFNARGAQFEGVGKENEANFNHMKVEQSASFESAIFRGPVDFVTADICSQFMAQGAQFQGQGPENKANFNSMKLGQSASFCGAKFNGPTDFRSIKVGEHFDLRPLQMSAKEKPQPTIFYSLANFAFSYIGGQLMASAAQFQGQGPENQANFRGMKVGLDSFFDNAVFQGTVDFGGAEIGRQFNAKGAQFQGRGRDNKANFNAMKVGQNAFFDNAAFHGPVDFIKANIGVQFVAIEARFENDKGTALFNGIKVEDMALFDGALFKGALNLAGAQLLDLMLHSLKEPLAELSLERTVVGRELSIRNASVGKLKARNLEVKVNATLEQVTIQEKADLRDSSFQALHLLDVNWPANRDEVWLEGLTYKAIYAGDKPKDCEKLLAWVERSRFNTQNYRELEAYFARCGHRDRADTVYIAGKSREKRKSRKELKEMRWWHLRRWILWLNNLLTQFLWGLLAGYGRKIWRIVWVSLAIICFGALVYDLGQFPDVQKKLSVAAEGLLPTIGLRLFLSWYILLSALPGWSTVLPLDSPAFGSFTFFCFWFQRFWGWLLVSTCLAALYTRLK